MDEDGFHIHAKKELGLFTEEHMDIEVVGDKTETIGGDKTETISGALNIISKSPVVNALTSTADLVKNKTEIIKDLIEPRIEELNKNFDKFEQVYNTINSEYYNYEGDAPPVFDVDGASTAKAEAKMITDFNS